MLSVRTTGWREVAWPGYGSQAGYCHLRGYAIIPSARFSILARLSDFPVHPHFPSYILARGSEHILKINGQSNRKGVKKLADNLTEQILKKQRTV